MGLTRQRRYSCMHSTALALLLFAVASFNEVKLSESCRSRIYSVLLENETWVSSNQSAPTESIIAAVNHTLVGTTTGCKSQVKMTGPSEPKGVVAQLELSVKMESFEISVKAFESALLKGITYGALNKTMKPFSRVFEVALNVSDPNTNHSVLEQSVKNVIGENTLVTLLLNESEYRTLRLWLNISVSQYPREALKSLEAAVQNGSVDGVAVKPSSFKAYLAYPISETKHFEVLFDYALKECDADKISNSSLAEYRSLHSELVKFLNATYNTLSEYIRVSISSLKCDVSNARAVSSAVHVTALVELEKSASSTPLSLGGALENCGSSDSNVSNIQVTLLNPSSLEDPTQAMITCPTTTKEPLPTTLGPSQKTTPPTEPSTAPPTLGKTPRLFVRLRLAITWSRFCSKLEDSLKHRIAKNVYDKEGNVVSADRVVFINSHKNCADPTKANDQVDLWFYITEKTETNNPSTCVTLKAQRVLKMMLDNGNTKLMGTDFSGKICCGAGRRRRRRRRYGDKHSNMELVVVDQANGQGAKVNGEGGKAVRQRHHQNHGGRAKGHGSDDDSDEYYDCCGGGGGGGRSSKDAKAKGKRKDKYKKSKGDAGEGDGNKGDKDGKDGDKAGNGNNNENQTDKGNGGSKNEGYEDMRGDKDKGNKRESLAPTIVTSPAPNTGTSTSYTNRTGGSPGERRGSYSKGGSPVSSRPSSGQSQLIKNAVDDELQRERRRSSISFLDDDAEPLKHKTATVGIVGLALRNKNEKKKETEFKNLDKDMPALGTYPASTAGKNRFPEILPNPRSRVKLTSSPDYINASYLHDHKGQRHYIATQHPLMESNDDFWQMVWERESCLIVMVNDDENSKQMDYPQYWPANEGGSMDFNGIVVSNKQVVTKADYVITTLVITNTKTKPSATREISHYRYTSWKDKHVPNIAMFVGFVVATRDIGRKHEDGKCPVIVHCSDGQGFTGVYVALDIGIRSHEESKNSVVDLFELAKRLRQGRCGIINSLQLYNFAYQVSMQAIGVVSEFSQF
ncbi:hypothetical protein QZH41_004279 [Actinostola sp. cb2023]|nr:hypothetical protein QZH41_004279 [Actinostola sp. cb2023]